MYSDREIMDHYWQSIHTMQIRDKNKRGRVPLSMMEDQIGRFTGDKNHDEKLGKAARISGNVVRVRRATS